MYQARVLHLQTTVLGSGSIQGAERVDIDHTGAPPRGRGNTPLLRLPRERMRLQQQTGLTVSLRVAHVSPRAVKNKKGTSRASTPAGGAQDFAWREDPRSLEGFGNGDGDGSDGVQPQDEYFRGDIEGEMELGRGDRYANEEGGYDNDGRGRGEDGGVFGDEEEVVEEYEQDRRRGAQAGTARGPRQARMGGNEEEEGSPEEGAPRGRQIFEYAQQRRQAEQRMRQGRGGDGEDGGYGGEEDDGGGGGYDDEQQQQAAAGREGRGRGRRRGGS